MKWKKPKLWSRGNYVYSALRRHTKFFDSMSAVFLLGQFLVHLVSCPVFYSVGQNASHSRISKSSAIVSTYPAISYSNN